MELTVKLQVFEGPLDLLLHLLDKNKVNIYDIPIVEITNQYMEYIREMKRQDLNVMSEFLVMAATLIDIKSKMLLPAKETEEEEAEVSFDDGVEESDIEAVGDSAQNTYGNFGYEKYNGGIRITNYTCLLYTSDAADE